VFFEEMGEEIFEEWMALECIERGKFKPDESDLPGIAHQQLQGMMRGK
jgi:hypothetical protein